MKVSAVQYRYNRNRTASLAIDASPLDTSIVISAYLLDGKPHFAFTFYVWRWMKRITR